MIATVVMGIIIIITIVYKSLYIYIYKYTYVHTYVHCQSGGAYVGLEVELNTATESQEPPSRYPVSRPFPRPTLLV